MNRTRERLKKNILLSCPFLESCPLPKSERVCEFPHYKICSEFQSSFNKLKSASKILH